MPQTDLDFLADYFYHQMGDNDRVYTYLIQLKPEDRIALRIAVETFGKNFNIFLTNDYANWSFKNR